MRFLRWVCGLIVAVVIGAGVALHWPPGEAHADKHVDGDLNARISALESSTALDALDERLQHSMDIIDAGNSTAHDRITNLTPLVGQIANLRGQFENIQAKFDELEELKRTVEAFAVQLAEVQNRKTVDSPGLTDVREAAARDMLQRLERVENEVDGFAEDGVIRGLAGSVNEDAAEIIKLWRIALRNDHLLGHIDPELVKQHPLGRDVHPPH